MAVLEQVMQMRSQGVSESEIIQYFKDQGVTQKEISDAIAQSKIKSELNREAVYNQGVFPQTQDYQQTTPEGYGQMPPTQEYQMQPSMISREEAPQANYPEQAPYQNYSKPYQEAVSQNYQDYYPEYQQTDIETMNEIAEQLIEERNEKLQKQISSLSAFKEEMSAEIERMNQRLEKIENNFNNLQASIIRKIGEYGEDIKTIAKEMHATQDSFSKMINPVIDNSRGMQEEQSQSVESEPKSRKTKKSTDFEDYLRQ